MVESTASATLKNKANTVKGILKLHEYSQLQQMLKTPTHTFGLAQLFRNFALLGDEDVKIEGLKLHEQFKEVLEKNQSQENATAFNDTLRLVKRIVYECPIKSIATRFYNLLNDFCNLELSTVLFEEDPISQFFDNSALPQVLNLPETLDPSLFKQSAINSTVSESTNFESNMTEDQNDESQNNMEHYYDQYAKQHVNLRKILDEIFYEGGCISPHFRLFCWFPRYLELYQTMFHNLIWDDSDGGTFSITEKLYLGIMAVSNYECEYLLGVLEYLFVLRGGNIKWINEGLKAVDSRIALFAEVSEIMAFIPWMLQNKHINHLINPPDDEQFSGLSAKQVLTGSMILSHFHSLCCFVQGQGLYDGNKTTQIAGQLLERKRSQSEDSEGAPTKYRNHDSHQKKRPKWSANSSNSSQRSRGPAQYEDETIQRLHAISEAEGDFEDSNSDQGDSENNSVKEQYDDSEIFTDVEITSQVSGDYSMSNSYRDRISATSDEEDSFSVLGQAGAGGKLSKDSQISTRFKKHRAGRLYGYQNFQQKTDPWHALEDFNWEDQAYGILNKYNAPAAEAINQLAEHCFFMTKKQYGMETVDTSPLRQGVRMYLMGIHGLKDDAYNYQAVNKILCKEHKVYIKKMMCSPQNVTLDDYEALPLLKAHDMAHLALLVMETKRRTELIYFVKVLSQTMSL